MSKHHVRPHRVTLFRLDGQSNPARVINFDEQVEVVPEVFIRPIAGQSCCFLENFSTHNEVIVDGEAIIDVAHLPLNTIFRINGEGYVIMADGVAIYLKKSSEVRTTHSDALGVFSSGHFKNTCHSDPEQRNGEKSLKRLFAKPQEDKFEIANETSVDEECGRLKLLRPSDSSWREDSGSVITEFIFVFPIFFMLCLAVLELSSMWITKHFLSLGAFESARSLVLEEVDNPCDEDNPQYGRIQARAKRAAVLRLAAVAPSYEYFIEQFTGAKPDNKFVQDSFSALGGLSASFLHLVKRVLPAYFLASVRCQYFDDESVSAELTFLYKPITPVVSDLIWVIYVAKEFSRIEKYVDWITSFLNRSQRDLLSHAISTYFPDTNLGAKRVFWGLFRPIDQVSLAVPEGLRFIPFSLSARLVKAVASRSGEAWDAGQVNVIAPFNREGSAALEKWQKWARNFATELHFKVKNER